MLPYASTAPVVHEVAHVASPNFSTSICRRWKSSGLSPGSTSELGSAAAPGRRRPGAGPLPTASCTLLAWRADRHDVYRAFRG